MTHINDFPNELLTKIFERLPVSCMDNVKEVCERWYIIANETVGVERYLGRRSGFFPLGSSQNTYDWYPMEEMLHQGIAKSCISIQSSSLGLYNNAVNNDLVSDTVSPGQEENLSQNLNLSQIKYPIFWAPYLVKSLTLYGDLSRPYFARLVQPLLNLTELEIHISSLSTLIPQKIPRIECFGDTPETINASITSKRLKSLRVSMKGFEFWHLQMLRPSKMSRCIENLYDLLRGHYPSLQRFELGFPFFWDKESDLTKSLSGFLRNHYQTLRNLALEFHYYWRLEDKSFEEMSVEDMNAYADIFELPELSSIVNLRCFNIDITDKRFIVPSIFYWEKLLLQQESLEYLKYKSGYHCSLPKPLIERNCATLKSICMTVRANSVLPVDCKVFEDCSKLEVLELDGGLRLIHQVIGDTRGPHIINCLCLPSSLKGLRLCSIFVGSEDADHICLRSWGLRTLHLEDIGQSDGLGVKFSTLCKICQRKTLESFKFTAAINEGSLDTAKKEWQEHSTMESLLMVLATFYELPKLIKREGDGCYVAEITGASALPLS